jgi:hypothetical protein
LSPHADHDEQERVLEGVEESRVVGHANQVVQAVKRMVLPTSEEMPRREVSSSEIRGPTDILRTEHGRAERPISRLAADEFACDKGGASLALALDRVEDMPIHL